MNAVTTTRTKIHPSFPNAADRNYFLDKLADAALSAAICIGVVSILFFLITMF